MQSLSNVQARSWKHVMQGVSVPKIQPMNQKVPAMNKQNFDYFLVLDFEATCEEGIKIMPHQVILLHTYIVCIIH